MQKLTSFSFSSVPETKSRTSERKIESLLRLEYHWLLLSNGLNPVKKDRLFQISSIIFDYNRIILHQNRYCNRLKSSKSTKIWLKIENDFRNRFWYWLKPCIFDNNQYQNRFRKSFPILNQIFVDFVDFNRLQYWFWCKIIRLWFTIILAFFTGFVSSSIHQMWYQHPRS